MCTYLRMGEDIVPSIWPSSNLTTVTFLLRVCVQHRELHASASRAITLIALLKSLTETYLVLSVNHPQCESALLTNHDTSCHACLQWHYTLCNLTVMPNCPMESRAKWIQITLLTTPEYLRLDWRRRLMNYYQEGSFHILACGVKES